MEQHVVEGLAALAGRTHEHAQVLAQAGLADHLAQVLRAQRLLGVAFVRLLSERDLSALHAVPFLPQGANRRSATRISSSSEAPGAAVSVAWATTRSAWLRG